MAEPEIQPAAQPVAVVPPAKPPPGGLDEITKLRQAGFNDNEISDWATQERTQLRQAGFNDNEIDAYFTNGVTVPDGTPVAVQNRLEAGTAAHKREGGIIQTIPQGIELMSSPEGRSKLWNAVKAYPAEFVKGMKETGKIGGDILNGKIDLHTQEGLDEAIGLGVLIATARFTKLGGMSKEGLVVRSSGVRGEIRGGAGQPPTPPADPDYNPGAAATVSRVERDPVTGEVSDLPIGDPAPTSQHFNDAASVVAGETPPNAAIQQKLLKLYQEAGKYPAEVAHDAQRDPVVQQELLARDPDVLPGVREPGPPVERGEPTGFTTAKGSTYELHGDGTTTRNKAPRADPGHEGDFGPKPRSEQTYYLSEEDTQKLAPPQDAVWRIVEEEKGTISLAIQNPKTGEWGIAPSQRRIPVTIEPGIGLQPLEMWGKGEINGRAAYSRIHPGNPITEMRPARAAGAPASLIDTARVKEAGNQIVNVDLNALDARLRAMDRALVEPKRTQAKEFLASQPKEWNPPEVNIRANTKTGEPVVEIIDGIHRWAAMKDMGLEVAPVEMSPAAAAQARQMGLTRTGTPPAATPPGVPPKPPTPPVPPTPPTPPGAPRPPLSLDVAQRLVHERISIGEREPGRFNLTRMYRELIDDLYPIRQITERGYQLARLTRGTFGKIEQFLNRGTFDFDTLKNNGRSLKDILADVKDHDEFRDYLVAKRAIEIADSGREPGVNVEAARVVAKGLDSTYRKVASDLVAYQNRVLEYLKKSGVLSDKAFDAMVQAGKDYVPFFRLLGGEERGIAGRSFGPESPIKRLKGSERQVIDPLESIIKNTYAYLSVAERNAAGIEIVEALQKQGLDVRTRPVPQIDVDLAEYLRDHGITNPHDLADFIQNAVPERGNTLGAFRDGKRVEVQINDPELVAAFRGLDRESSGMLVKVLSLPAKYLRAGAVLTPDFMARNLIRDFMTAFINTKGTLFHPLDTLQGLYSVITKDERYQNWVKSGGANATMVALDRRYMQESLAKLNGETGLMRRGWNVITSPIRGLRAVSEMIENSTRVAEYSKALGKATGKEAMQEAGFVAREVTLDFARIGAKMRAYNMITAFANAQIQGVDRMVRAFKDRPINTSLKVAGGVTLPSVLLWWANKDDKRVQELPAWQKDLFWIIPTDSWEPISAADAAGRPAHLVRQRDGQWEFNNGTIFRIPKPFEVGVIFGSGPERLLDATFSDNPESFRGFGKSVMQALTPGVVPTAVLPMVEQFANRSTFTDRTLIPGYLERGAGGLPEYQYTPYTTELTKKLGSIISSFPGMRETAMDPGSVLGGTARAVTSPILIENYVRAWTGGLGVYAMNAADASLRKAGILPDPIKPTDTLADIPFVKAFVVRYPSASSESIQRFYDDYGRNKRFYDALKAKEKEGDAEAVQTIIKAGGDAMFLRLDGIQKTLGQQSKMVRDIYKNPTIPADEKRQLIDSTYYRMIQLAQGGNTMMRQVRERQQARQSPFPQINMAPNVGRPAGLPPVEGLGFRG